MFKDAYYALAARITEILHNHHSPSWDAATLSPVVSDVSNRSESRINIRLPKLDLPRFSGQYDEWFLYRQNGVSFVAIQFNKEDARV